VPRIPSLRLEGVSKRFDGIVAADDVSLEVKDGEYIVILGPTGAGKTTLMKMIAGLTAPDSGRIFVDGKRVDKLPPEDRGMVYLSQTYALFRHMTVWDNTKFGPTVKDWGESKSDLLAKEMLNLVRLYDRRTARPDELSGGMKQRNALARALATDVKILLLDEPLRALDARLRIELRYELMRLTSDLGITALHVTHDQEIAMTMADKVAVLRKGRIEQLGRAEEIYDNPARPFICHFVGEANFFEGTVHSVSDDHSELEGEGYTLRSRATDLPKGTEACMGIKTENVRLLDGIVDGQNHIPAKVVRRLFLGRLMSVVIETDDGKKLHVKTPSSAGLKFDKGKEVTAHLEPSKCIIFPIPEKGLKEELEVE
jgi:ABC-type Fe3+/spermidine/putrescine transport system ATPase subunit